MLYYHATTTPERAWAIEADGFRGGDVWDLRDVVFVAAAPLHGFAVGLLSYETWIAVEVPDAALGLGEYPYKFSDDDEYGTDCRAFPAALINQWPRRAIT